jgi:1,4-alpha-glucan branching enzyme
MGKKNKKNVGAVVHSRGVGFRVWAPFAASVAVIGSFNNWSPTPLENEQDGYWFVDVPGAKAGQEYKFSITNGDNTYVRNDPRAMHFTTSAGNSVIVSTAFDWGTDTFKPIPFNEQVIYELHIGTFNRADPAITGTFYDASAKLDYLAELGVNMVELMPIGSMMMDRGWGYAIDYIFAVESLYGGRHGFLQFVKDAHQRGIGVILDVVYNHFGPDSSLDLWQFDGWNQDGKGGIYFYNDWRSETPWGSTRPDFGRAEVQQYILDNVKMWMHDCRVDGLRVDSTIFIRNVKGYNNDPSTDLPEGWGLLQKINSVAKKINPAAITVAEDVGGNEYITKPASEGGADFSAQWEIGLPHALRDALWTADPDKINLAGVCSVLGQRYNDDPFQRVLFSDSHDSAANGGARLAEVVSPGKATNTLARKQSIIAAAVVMSAPGIPMLFQGQEFMEGGCFNDWEQLDWAKAEKYAGVVQAHKHLVALRRNIGGATAGLQGRGFNIMHLDENNKVLTYHRWSQGGPRDDVVVVINFSKNLQPVYSMNFPRNGKWKVRFNSAWKGYSPDFKEVKLDDVTVESGNGTLALPPNCALILSQDE